jgi:hypothetical protein
MLVISRVTSAQLAEGPYCRPNSGEAVDPAEGVGQPVAACHAADQIRGLVAGHPGGRDIHGPGGAFPRATGTAWVATRKAVLATAMTGTPNSAYA